MKYKCMALAFLLLSNTYAKQLDLDSMVSKYEGFRANPYIDSDGMSIGYGTHLPLTQYEGKLLMIHRLSIAEDKLKRYSWYSRLSHNRKVILIQIVYQLGLTRFLKFNRTIWCLENRYYHAAANHLRNSLWYKQSGTRSKELVKLFYKG